MNPRKAILWVFEGGVVLLFVIFAVLSRTQSGDSVAIAPIDPEALKMEIGEKEWFGVYFLDQKVGYAATTRSPLQDGGELVHTEAAYTMAAAGQIARSVLASSAILDDQKRLRQFDFFLSANPVRLAARGEFRGDRLVLEVFQAGEKQQIELPMAEAPQVGASMPAWVDSLETIREGEVHELPYFDPVSLTQRTITVRVDGTELLANGEEAYWFERDFGGVSTRSLMLSNGEMLREESAMGLTMKRETADEARSLPTNDNVVDVIALSAVPLDKNIGDARERQRMRLRVLGVEGSALLHDPPLQRIAGDEVHVEIPAVESLPELPVAAEEELLAEFTKTDAFLMSDHAEIQAKSREVLGEATTRTEAAARLSSWVYGALDKVPTLGIPNALEVLRVGQGDCNEHTALYVSIARAAGMPARIAAGVVYSDRIADEGAFFYHAWPEVYFGEAGWVPVDPTFDQFPADATHIKVVEGGLDKQIAIMGVMGRLGFELLKPE